MKTLLEKFTDDEFIQLKKEKEKTGLTWHDWLLTLTGKDK